MNALTCFLINVIHLILLIKAILFSIKKESGWFNIVSFYSLCELFFFTVPVCFDSLYASIFSIDQLKNILISYNSSASSAVYDTSLSVETLYTMSLYSLLFDSLLFLVYHCIKKRELNPVSVELKKVNDDNHVYFTPFVYYACAWFGVLFWGLRYGINFKNAGFGYRSLTQGTLSHPVFIIISSALSSAALPGLNLLFKNKILNYIIIGLPFAIVGFLTRSRALFISFFCIVLYFIEKKQYGKNLKRLPLYLMLLTLFLSFALGIRSGEFSIYFYPVWRDASFTDAYFSFANSYSLFNNGKGMQMLASTGIPFLAWYQPDLDIIYLLANLRFYEGWGSLHPTLYGWSYIDFEWFSLSYALFWGAVFSISERIHKWLTPPLDTMYLGCQFSFVCILTRGSCQVAYSGFIYPTIIFIIANLLLPKLPFKKLIYTKENTESTYDSISPKETV